MGKSTRLSRIEIRISQINLANNLNKLTFIFSVDHTYANLLRMHKISKITENREYLKFSIHTQMVYTLNDSFDITTEHKYCTPRPRYQSFLGMMMLPRTRFKISLLSLGSMMFPRRYAKIRNPFKKGTGHQAHSS